MSYNTIIYGMSAEVKLHRERLFGPNNHKLHRLNRYRVEKPMFERRKAPLPSQVGNHIADVRSEQFERIEKFHLPKPDDIAEKGDN